MLIFVLTTALFPNEHLIEGVPVFELKVTLTIYVLPISNVVKLAIGNWAPCSWSSSPEPALLVVVATILSLSAL